MQLKPINLAEKNEGTSLPLDFSQRMEYNNIMNDELKVICKTVEENKIILGFVDEAAESVISLYEYLVSKAKEQNCFIENNGFYKYEKFYFKYEDKIHCWQKVYSPEPYFMFEIVNETNYKMCVWQSD